MARRQSGLRRVVVDVEFFQQITKKLDTGSYQLNNAHKPKYFKDAICSITIDHHIICTALSYTYLNEQEYGSKRKIDN